MRRLAVLVALLSALSACGASDTEGAGQDTTLTVFAAASLQDTFTEIGRQFEADHAGVTVAFSFAGSADLVAQLQQGAPADVFASADEATMDKAIDDDLVSYVADFATNVLEIATPPSNPADVDSLADLAEPGTRVVVCAPEVPCGAAAVRTEQAAGVDIDPVSEEQSVTDVLGKISSGEADAGLVYATDVKAAADKVLGVELPASAAAVNTYPLATLSGGESPEVARAFADFVTGPAGQAVLAAAEFGRP